MPTNDQISDRVAIMGPVTIFIMILLAIFISELVTMQVFSPYLPPLDTVKGGLIDAAVMVVLAAVPLWFLLVRLPRGETPDSAARRSSALILLVQCLAGIFVVEFLVTLALMVILTGSTALIRDLTDAFLTAVCCAVPLWFSIIRPTHVA